MSTQTLELDGFEVEIASELYCTRRIDPVDRVVLGVGIRGGVQSIALIGIHGQEPARCRVVISRPQVICTECTVILLAAVEEIVRRGAAGRDRHAEGVVRVAVGHGCRCFPSGSEHCHGRRSRRSSASTCC